MINKLELEEMVSAAESSLSRYQHGVIDLGTLQKKLSGLETCLRTNSLQTTSADLAAARTRIIGQINVTVTSDYKPLNEKDKAELESWSDRFKELGLASVTLPDPTRSQPDRAAKKPRGPE